MSPRILHIISHLFHKNSHQKVIELLEKECGHTQLRTNGNEGGLERIHFAVLKLSEGNIEKLKHETKEATIDWRDVLMAAGFGCDVAAHGRWYEEIQKRLK
ncbi:MAG: hypothetical protein HYV29_11495 [Ignavibacteriales bacterium]|nr:hypothetical protein [Ignavibacteriales bacterium]